MTKQQEIREDAIIITKDQLWAEGIRDEQRLAVRAIQIVDQIFNRLNEKGVVIKVERAKSPDDFVAVEPLIKETKDA